MVMKYVWNIYEEKIRKKNNWESLLASTQSMHKYQISVRWVRRTADMLDGAYYWPIPIADPIIGTTLVSISSYLILCVHDCMYLYFELCFLVGILSQFESIISGSLPTCVGSYGECVSARRGCFNTRWALYQWREDSASQKHCHVSPWTSNYYVIRPFTDLKKIFEFYFPLQSCFWSLIINFQFIKLL